MKLAVALGMDEGEALCTEKLMALLTENRGTRLITLIAERVHRNLRYCVVAPVAIEMTLPEARNAEVILAVIAMEGSSTIFAFFTLLLRLDDFSI